MKVFGLLMTFLLLMNFCAIQAIGCTGGVAIHDATFDGRPVLWQVMDYASGHSLLWKYKDSKEEVLYYGLGAGSTAHSLNSHGLARGVNEQKTLDYDGDGAWNPLRDNIDRGCTSIADVRNILETKNYGGGKSYPFIDATGEGTMFEVADNDYWEYYPTNPSRLNNPDYDYSSPNNFVVRANMPFQNSSHQEMESVIDGWNNESTRRHRYARAEMAGKINDADKLTPRELFEICRHGNPGINDDLGVICEARSKVATVYLGIKNGENPAFTTALYAMGIPDYSIFIPAWCKLTSGDLSKCVKSADPTIYSAVRELFDKNKNDGNGLDSSDDEFVREAFNLVEENIIEGVLSARDKWLNRGDTDNYYEDMKRLHGLSCDAAYWTISSACHTVDFGARTMNEPPSISSLAPDIHGLNIGFNCSASDMDGLQSIEWDFGDGSTVTGTLTPSHTYTQAGTYLVSCYVEDGNTHKAANVRFEYVAVSSVPEPSVMVLAGTALIGVAIAALYRVLRQG